VGLQTLRRVEQVVAFALQRLDVGDQLFGFDLTRFRLDDRRVGGGHGGIRIRRDGVVPPVGHDDQALCSSSTISASATSSSDGASPASAAPGVPGPCCACALSYRRRVNSWLTLTSASCACLTASMSGPARASFNA